MCVQEHQFSTIGEYLVGFFLSLISFLNFIFKKSKYVHFCTAFYLLAHCIQQFQ